MMLKFKRMFAGGMVKAELDATGSEAVLKLTIDPVIQEVRRQIYKTFYEALVDACPFVCYCGPSALDFLHEEQLRLFR